jgi:excisionase family DNA binding protein
VDEPLAYSVEEAACLLGISRTKAYECVRTGQLRTIQLNRRLLVPAVAIDEHSARRRSESATGPSGDRWRRG